MSVALADMGALEGVLASKAGELFDSFDVDGDGQVDLDEFEVLVEKVKALRGSVASKATPEIPEGFAESAAALPLRKSFEAFAAFGKGARTGESVEHINGRDWSKLVKDCGLVGGAVNSAAADIIFASASRQAGQRVLHWENGSFLHALAAVAAEHRVTFGQVAQRVSQCAPSERNLQTSAAAGSSERAAAAAARAAAESANGPTPENVTTAAALRSIFSQYSSGAPGLAPLEALHALSDLGLLRGASPDACQSAVTAAISSTAEDGGAPEGTVSFEAFAACGAKLASSRAKGNYRPPDDVHLQLDQRRALRESYEKFAGSKHGMKPDGWEATMRACGLISAKCADACAAVIFAKCKTGAGSRSLAPKVMSFEGFAQAPRRTSPRSIPSSSTSSRSASSSARPATARKPRLRPKCRRNLRRRTESNIPRRPGRRSRRRRPRRRRRPTAAVASTKFPRRRPPPPRRPHSRSPRHRRATRR